MEFIKSFFKLEERGSGLTRELIGGLTTFLAMAYILPVNSFMLAKTGIPLGGVFLATALAAAIASIVMGILANLPVALAPGMGLNAFFTYTLVFGMGLSWQAALAAVLVSGVLFFIISVTGLRKIVINAIPAGLKFAVGAGIGFFITFIGLKNAGIIVDDGATLVALGDFSHPAVLLGLFGILLVVVLYSMGNRFSLIISIFATAVVGLVLGAVAPDFFTVAAVGPESTNAGIELMVMPAYSNFSISEVWTGAGKTIGAAFGGFGELFSSASAFTIIFALLFVDFFDTAGTLMAVGNQAGLVNDEGELVGSEKALLVDSIGTMTGAVLGTSNVTSYIESATGIESGARTGLSSVVVGLLFILAIFLYPLLSIVNGVVIGFDAYNDVVVYAPVTSMALVMVGALMVGQLKEVDWNDKAIVIPAFLTIVMMMLTYSIATGIAVGFIFYPVVKLAQGKGKEVNIVMYILAVLFVLNFVLGAI
ncbi:Guanine/hypoxanthine permease PbuG [Candidatus Izimaplasma bacterium HR1]|uniref:NCS2 family permease n=1 Tax=Candidatus Izimoplasma sp. HR1 TaxID=1541959 RepID=UPI0004F5FD20|nr:Guanine/hypoxanthine permease PbuG [Candidatus Izimaplasma bacterium HR1]